MKISLKILVHSIFWMVFLAFTMLFSYMVQHNGIQMYPYQYWGALFINTIWAVAIFYLFYLRFYKFFEKRFYTKYLAVSVISALLLTAFFIPFFKLIIQNFSLTDYRNFGPPAVGSFILAQCGCLVRGFENWFDSMKLKMELENKNLKNELELLKSQVNPHFLFNSLNNIDSLIAKSPEDASKALITLSDMLRYMIYETKADFVPLYKEIGYLENFISLQRLRFRNNSYIKVDFTNECNGLVVAPMLFIPFVENAFKHSVYTGSYPVVFVALSCKENKVFFSCKNYFTSETGQVRKPGGIGLENIQKRLALIYPEKHTLEIRKEKDVFEIELIIQN